MKDFIDLIFSDANIILTVAVIILAIYWIITAISGLDFDVDVEIDIDADMDVDLTDGGSMDFEDGASTEIDKDQIRNKRRKPLKWWQVFLVYFNFVGLPFVFTLTTWFVIWWIATLITTSWTETENNVLGQIFMLALMIPALIANKFFTIPFKSFFKHVNKDGDRPIDFLGRTAVLNSTISGDKLGNAEVDADGNSMSIYVKSLDGSELRFRESVLIIKQSHDKNYFYVNKL